MNKKFWIKLIIHKLNQQRLELTDDLSDYGIGKNEAIIEINDKIDREIKKLEYLLN